MRNGPSGWKLKASGFYGSGIQRWYEIVKPFRRRFGLPWMTATGPPPQSSPASGEEEDSSDERLGREHRHHTHRPGPSICFVTSGPKPREVFAAQFRDRVGQYENTYCPPARPSFLSGSAARS